MTATEQSQLDRIEELLLKLHALMGHVEPAPRPLTSFESRIADAEALRKMKAERRSRQ